MLESSSSLQKQLRHLPATTVHCAPQPNCVFRTKPSTRSDSNHQSFRFKPATHSGLIRSTYSVSDKASHSGLNPPLWAGC